MTGISGKAAYLEITSFVGLAPGAVHYYGSLYFHDGAEMKHVDLWHPLTRGGAARLNKFHGFGSLYKPGMKTKGFEKESQIVAQAISEYKTHAPNAIVLFRGNVAYADPMPCLDGPAKFKQLANRLYKCAERIDFWANEKRMRPISATWDDLLTHIDDFVVRDGLAAVPQ